MAKLCPKCGRDDHSPGERCKRPRVRARSSAVERPAFNRDAAGSTPAAPTTDIPASSSGRTPAFEVGNEGSIPSAGAIEASDRQPITIQSRLPEADTTGQVLDLVSAPYEHLKLSPDRDGASVDDLLVMDVAGRLAAACGVDRALAEKAVAFLEGRSTKTKPAKEGFDRRAYQRKYMRDLPKAKACGLTVKQYRLQQKASDE